MIIRGSCAWATGNTVCRPATAVPYAGHARTRAGGGQQHTCLMLSRFGGTATRRGAREGDTAWYRGSTSPSSCADGSGDMVLQGGGLAGPLQGMHAQCGAYGTATRTTMPAAAGALLQGQGAPIGRGMAAMFLVCHTSHPNPNTLTPRVGGDSTRLAGHSRPPLPDFPPRSRLWVRHLTCQPHMPPACPSPLPFGPPPIPSPGTGSGLASSACSPMCSSSGGDVPRSASPGAWSKAEPHSSTMPPCPAEHASFAAAVAAPARRRRTKRAVCAGGMGSGDDRRAWVWRAPCTLCSGGAPRRAFPYPPSKHTHMSTHTVATAW